MGWRDLTTEQRIRAIRDVFPTTGTQGRIAAALSAIYGETITRNSICGMYDRHRAALQDLRLTGQQRDYPERECKPRKPRTAKPVAAAPAKPEVAEGKRIPLKPPKMAEAPPPELLPAPHAVSQPKRMIDLARCECRWPMFGEKADTLFCALPADGSSPYCAHHHHQSVGKGTISERLALRELRRAA